MVGVSELRSGHTGLYLAHSSLLFWIFILPHSWNILLYDIFFHFQNQKLSLYKFVFILSNIHECLETTFKVKCLITCLELYWPKFIEFLLISCYFGIGSVSSFFIWLKISLLDVKMSKKKERQTFRPHMGALFSAINSKINSKFLKNIRI